MLRTGITAVLCIAVVSFYSRFLIALIKDLKPRRASRLTSSMQLKRVASPHMATEATSEIKNFQFEMDGKTLKTERKQFNRSVTWKIVMVVLLLSISRRAIGQAPQREMLHSERDGTLSTTNNVATSDHVNAEILDELERLRTRIQELESRLNQGEAAKSPTSAELASQGTEQQPLGASKEQTPEPKAEPFAFADWTWLNGNPRTKEAAFDSKFSTRSSGRCGIPLRLQPPEGRHDQWFERSVSVQ
jgi:hypothetical protein